MIENIDIPLVSIIIPSFNQGLFIEETIQSVLSQDYGNIEFIIIDGGSSDKTVDIIKKYEHKISYWISEKDEGQTDAITKGFSRAKGKYITWLCSDDVLEPSMVSNSVSYLEAHPEVVMSYGNRTRIDEKGNIIGVQKNCQFRPWLLCWGFAIPQETSLIRRKSYDRTDGLDKSLHMAMDFDLFCKLSKVGKIVHLPLFLGRFRTYDTNKSRIFSDQIATSGFTRGAPLELAEVYKKHYGKKFPVRKWKNLSLIDSILLQYDKRSRAFKEIQNFFTNLKSR